MNKKSLVVYYSYEGNTKLIAEAIKEITKSDIIELRPIKEMSSTGFMKYMWGGKNVFLRKKPNLEPFEKNPEDYDLLFIGTPVWVMTYAPPLRTFFSSVSLNNKEIGLFCCHEGGIGKTFERMGKALPGNIIIGTIDFNHPLHNNPEQQQLRAEEWAKSLIHTKK